MARVFVVQQPAFFDREARKFVPKYDLSPASKHGRLVYLLGPGNIFKDKLAQARTQLEAVLKDFTADDSLLAVGDPVAIAMASVIAAQRTGGRVNVLKWDRIAGSYEVYPINLASES